jgi:hypothetical protein
MKIRNHTQKITKDIPEKYREFVEKTIENTDMQSCPEDSGYACSDCIFGVISDQCFITDDYEILDEAPDLSNDPEANELIDRLNSPSEAQKPTSKGLAEQMDDIITEDEESRFEAYLVKNLRLKYQLTDDEKPAELVLELGGKILGKVQV